MKSRENVQRVVVVAFVHSIMLRMIVFLVLREIRYVRTPKWCLLKSAGREEKDYSVSIFSIERSIRTIFCIETT